MSKPRDEIKEKEYFKDIYFLYEIIGTLKNVDEVKRFIKDILTRSELRMLKKRWHIANMLLDGRFNIRQIASRTKASTQTVSKIKRVMEDGQGGLLLALERTLQKIEKEKKDRRFKGSSKYVKGWFQ